MSSRGWASPSSSRSRPPTRARPPPRSSIRRGMTSKLRVAPDSIARPSTPGSRFAPRVSMLWTSSQLQVGDARRGAGPARRCAAGWAPRRSGPGGLNRWIGHVVGVVGPLALRPGPVEDRAPAGVADLLLVLVERLVAGLFPEEGQVAGHRDQPLADRLAAREVDRAVVAVVARSARGGARWRRASGSWSSRRAGSSTPKPSLGLAGLGQVDLQEAAVPAVEQ